MRRFCIFFIVLAAFFASCGGGSNLEEYDESVVTQLPPVISRIDPAAGTAGDAITIFGFGFSSAAEANIVMIGGSTVQAETYNILSPATDDEIEQITFTVPNNLTAGATTVSVFVFENTSNTIDFTVN